MKKFILSFILTASLVFAQHRGGGSVHGGFGHPIGHPPVIVRSAPVYVGPGYGYGFGFGLGFYPYWYPGFGWMYISVTNSQACKKQKLKSEDGVKHQILVCRQDDGTIKIIFPNGKVQ